MASALDIAKYIIEKQGEMTAMKLQKLIYYSQAWSLVRDEKPMFDETIEAWANGPIVREVYDKHKGKFSIKSWKFGSTKKLTKENTDTIDSVLEVYGKLSGSQLSELTHREDPWRDARKGLFPGERGSNKISISSMHEYYSSFVK